MVPEHFFIKCAIACGWFTSLLIIGGGAVLIIKKPRLPWGSLEIFGVMLMFFGTVLLAAVAVVARQHE
jgi:hypothetical protein